MRIIRLAKPYLLLGSAIVLAAAAGLLTATALGVGAQAPTQTTTITLTNGEPGPAGPPGPPGTPGAEGCPSGSTFGALRINHPGGHVTIWTCVANEG